MSTINNITGSEESVYSGIKRCVCAGFWDIINTGRKEQPTEAVLRPCAFTNNIVISPASCLQTAFLYNMDSDLWPVSTYCMQLFILFTLRTF